MKWESSRHQRQPESRWAHRKLARHVTTLVHGGRSRFESFSRSQLGLEPYCFFFCSRRSAEKGLRSAERVTAALYSKSLDSLLELDAAELMETFRGATVVELLLQPATSLLDVAMRAKCFANEGLFVSLVATL